MKVLLLLDLKHPCCDFVVVICSWIDEGDHDVPCALRDGETLVVVREPARVHQHPALLRRLHRAVVPESEIILYVLPRANKSNLKD